MNPPPIYDPDDDEARERHDAHNPHIRGLEIEAAERGLDKPEGPAWLCCAKIAITCLCLGLVLLMAIGIVAVIRHG